MPSMTALVVLSWITQSPQASDPWPFLTWNQNRETCGKTPFVKRWFEVFDCAQWGPQKDPASVSPCLLTLSLARRAVNLLYMADRGSTALQWQTRCSVAVFLMKIFPYNDYEDSFASLFFFYSMPHLMIFNHFFLMWPKCIPCLSILIYSTCKKQRETNRKPPSCNHWFNISYV